MNSYFADGGWRSDLLTPGVLRRITFTTLGVFRGPDCVSTWAADETKYGGIRHCRHYSSGVYNNDTAFQPYAVNSLNDCRIHDQLLPAPFKTKHEKLEEPWPGHPYTSHICRCEVFPRFDPGCTEFDTPSQRKLRQQLCSSTRDALEHLSKKIYCTSEYKDSMKATVGFEETAAEYQQKGENKVDEFHDKDNDFSELKDWEVIDLEETEKKKPSESDNERSDEDQIDKNHQNELNYSKKAGEENSSKVAGVWPIWPAGQSNIDKMSPNYPKLPLPKYSTLNFAKRNQLQDEQNRLPMIPQETTAMLSHGAQEGKKYCTKGMLGERFKTEAHKRCQEIYYDAVPDLRDSLKTGRQHFFWGVHACILR
ncbi:uncharacterized protein [Acropora muricata]|uniref:uncharacterized protein n=1 Tax=Acropora muricata TaxID=159855 RepID=UPI0034E37F00